MTRHPMGAGNGPVRAVVIGTGVMGRHHVRVLSQVDHVELVGVVDAASEARERIAKLIACPVYADVEECLGLRPDLAVVATPTSSHREVCEILLRSRVNVLVEKPIAGTSAEGRSMVTLAAREGVVLGVGHVERFNPVVTALRDLLRAGAIGAPHAFETRRFGPFPPRIRDVGVIVDLASHDIDVVLDLHAARISRIQAETRSGRRGAREDAVSALLRFADGVIATIQANWLAPMKVREIAATGEQGMLVADYQSQELTLLHRAHVADERLTGSGYAVDRQSTDISVPRAEPLRVELEAFVAAIKGEREFAVTGAQALRVLRAAEIITSAASDPTSGTGLDV